MRRTREIESKQCSVLRNGHVSFDAIFKRDTKMTGFGDGGVISVVDGSCSDGELAGVYVVAGADLRKNWEVAETGIASCSRIMEC